MATNNRPSLLQSLMGIEVLLLLLVTAIMVIVFVVADNQRLRANLQKIQTAFDESDCNKKLCDCVDRLKKAKVPTDDLGKKLNDQPPIITLGEADGFFFPSGSADVPEEFRQKLREGIVPEIMTLSAQYGTDVVEVVGHTDEVPKGGRTNLDRELLSFLNNESGVELHAADNVGLGMARAAAVVRLLLDDTRLQLRVIPLSAGQVLLPNGAVADGSSAHVSQENRRRIEIRLKRSQTAPAAPTP